jgi:hypothetical protein
VNTRPSFSTSGSAGRSSSATEPAGLHVDGVRHEVALERSRTERATAMPALSWRLDVEAPRCGATTTESKPNSGESVHGSVA